MATVYSTQYTLLNNVPAEKLDPDVGYGKVRCLYASYTVTADLAAADIIKMFRIPKGARVVDLKIDYTDLDASGGTVDAGWSKDLLNLGTTAGGEDADADGFVAASDVTSALKVAGIAAGIPGFGKKFAAECDFQLATVGDTDATSGTIKVALFIVVE